MMILSGWIIISASVLVLVVGVGGTLVVDLDLLHSVRARSQFGALARGRAQPPSLEMCDATSSLSRRAHKALHRVRFERIPTPQMRTADRERKLWSPENGRGRRLCSCARLGPVLALGLAVSIAPRRIRLTSTKINDCHVAPAQPHGDTLLRAPCSLQLTTSRPCCGRSPATASR